MKEVLTLGESMVRLSTQKGNRLSNATLLHLHYGGAEANVAINLSQLGHKVKHATKLPINNGLSESVVGELQGHGVDCSNVLYSEGRLGSYYLEVGTGLRPTNIIYDRAYSTISMMKEIEWDLDKLFDNVSIFHLTGITLALSEDWQSMGLTLIKEAKKRDIKISFDMNYRQKMWSAEEAKKTFEQVLPHIDYLSAGKLDAIHFMDIAEKEDSDWEYYAQNMAEKYPNLQYIYGTNRELRTPNSYKMTGYIWDSVNSCGVVSSEYKNYTVVDRVGTGDSYTAGVLDGIINKKSLENIVEFAIASSALKHTVHGDINPFSRTEIDNFIGSTSDVMR
ncbi:MAG: sugar kinase [Saprospiraceae bacterium]|nr:sugar kinase [Saprospiraceae bacterium]